MHKDTIFYVSPIDNTVIRYYGKEFIPAEIKNPKKLFIGSRVLYQDITTHTFKIDKNELQNNLETVIEMKMYEEAGLNLQKVYKIEYLIKESQVEESYLIEAFAIDKEKIEQKFEKFLQKAKHIDFLAMPFLSYTTLYKNDILKKANDVFIYISDDEAYAAFYKDGEYISSKSLPTLNNIAKEVQKYSTHTLESETLKKLLFEKGLVKENYDVSEYDLCDTLQTVFSNIFTKIGNVAIHNRNIYGFDQIERVFFAIDDQNIKGIEEFLKLLGIEKNILYKHSFFNTKNRYNQLDLISTLYIYDKAKEEDNNNNLTIFHRKKSFFKKEIGKIFSFSLASLLLFSLFGLYKHYSVSLLEKEYEELNTKYTDIQNSTFTTKERIRKLQKQLASLEKELQQRKEKINKIGNIMEEITKLEPKNQKYTKMIIDINNLLAKYNLEVEQIKQKSQNELTLKIISQENRRDTIAKFMQDLIEDSYKGVTTAEITGNAEAYTSLIEIKR